MNSAIRSPQHLSRHCPENRSIDWRPRLALGICLLAGILLPGCGAPPETDTQFGSVDSTNRQRSLNGLGLHRRVWESAGVRCVVARKLSPRLNDIDVIVLVGQSYAPPGLDARRWLESWLEAKPGRTLIYFGRDLDGRVYYQNETLAQLTDPQQEQGKIARARNQAGELSMRLDVAPNSTFCRWFYMDTGHRRTTCTQFQGPWAEELNSLQGSWPVGIALRQPDAEDWQNQKPSWLAPATGTQNLFPIMTGPYSPPGDRQVFRSSWSVRELESDDVWDSQFDDLPDSRQLLAAEDGTPLVYSLTIPDAPNSQIIVAANGAPFLNATLVTPFHRHVCEKLIAECLPANRLAFLPFDQNGILISNIPEQDARGAGLEMFLVWPLGLLTIPAVLIGIIACIAMLPILGRPQRLRPAAVTDFGLHIEAVGRLLQATRDTAYAKSVITQYFQRVRGETPPRWLHPNPGPPAQTPQPTIPPTPSEPSSQPPEDASSKPSG